MTNIRTGGLHKRAVCSPCRLNKIICQCFLTIKNIRFVISETRRYTRIGDKRLDVGIGFFSFLKTGALCGGGGEMADERSFLFRVGDKNGVKIIN